MDGILILSLISSFRAIYLYSHLNPAFITSFHDSSTVRFWKVMHILKNSWTDFWSWTLFTLRRLHRKLIELINLFSKAWIWCLWSYVVKETGVPGGNDVPWMGDHYLATCQHREWILGHSADKQGFLPQPYPGPQLIFDMMKLIIGPGHAKTCLKPYANNKGADQPAHSRSLISTFVVRCLDSMICILAISKVSRF